MKIFSFEYVLWSHSVEMPPCRPAGTGQFSVLTHFIVINTMSRKLIIYLLIFVSTCKEKYCFLSNHSLEDIKNRVMLKILVGILKNKVITHWVKFGVVCRCCFVKCSQACVGQTHTRLWCASLCLALTHRSGVWPRLQCCVWHHIL